MNIKTVSAKEYGTKSKAIDKTTLYIYCGTQSGFANPFTASEDESTPSELECYIKEAFPYGEIYRLMKYCSERNIEELLLGCFCAGINCHCEAIKAFMDKNPKIFKFKDLDFKEHAQCTIRLAEKTQEYFRTGERCLLVTADDSKVEPAMIAEVHQVPFYKLNSTHSRYLTMQHNPECRTYDSLKECMGEFYKIPIEDKDVILIRFKMDKFRGLFD